MAQKLAYQTSKWEKEVQKDIKRYKQLKGLDPIMKNMELGLSCERDKAPDKRNYAACYEALHLEYRILAGRSYLRNNSDLQAIHYTYLSGIAAIFSYLFDIANPPAERHKTDQINMVYDFSLGLFQLFASQEFLPKCLSSLEHPYVQLLLGNFEKAVDLLSATNDTFDPAKPYAVLMGDRSQAAVRAMAGRDEKVLNNLLVQHVKTYRKQPVDYATFIDAYSIAYIKLARQHGMSCELDIIEVPKMFFDNEACAAGIADAQLPFYDDAVIELKKLGIAWE